jgi:hypothetical protein
MQILRGLILLGSLGRVWATSRKARNVYQSISILAYFKIMNDMESNRETVIPTIKADNPPQIIQQMKSYQFKTRRMKTIQCIQEINRVTNDY